MMSKTYQTFIVALFLGVSSFVSIAAPLDYNIDGQRKTLELLDKNRVSKPLSQPSGFIYK